jgi:site-specific DNA-cytosine methylase
MMDTAPIQTEQMRGDKEMNVLSLFDGMSCGQLALQRAGIQVDNYFASEIDRYAIQVATANFPAMIQLGDVKEVWVSNDLSTKEKGISHEGKIHKIDLLIGGSPCQGFSFAGKQLNFDDPRSKLFWEYVRLLKALKPKYFLLENVKMKKESMDVITNALGVEPIFINSNRVSAQNRQRYYWTNIPMESLPDDKGIVLSDILEDGHVDRDKSHCIDANYFKGGNLKSYFEKHRRQLVFSKDGMCHVGTEYRKLTPLECERLQTVPEGYTDHVSNTQRYKMLGNGWTVDVVSHIFGGI